MNDRIDRWLNLAQYTDRVERDRAIRLGWTLLFLVAFPLLQLGIDIGMLAAGLMPSLDPVALGSVFGVMALSVVGWELVRRGHLELAANIVAAGLFAAVMMIGWFWDLNSTISTVVPASAVIVVAITRRPAATVYSVASAGLGALFILAKPGVVSSPGEGERAINAATLVVVTLLVAGVSGALVATLQRATWRSEERLRSMALSARLSERLSAATDAPWLIDQATDLLWDAYTQADHIRTFMIEGDQIVLVGTSDGECRPVTDPAQVPPLSGPGLVSRVVAGRQAVVLRDTSVQAVYPGDKLRPDTRSALALPLLVGEDVVGVLEFQSAAPDAFSSGDVDLMQPAANLIASNLARTRALEALRQRAETAERQLREALASAARASREGRQELVKAWDQYLKSLGGGQSLQLDLETLTTLRIDAWTPTLKEAVEQGRPVTASSGTGNMIAVPIRAAGQVIGAMEFEVGHVPSEQDVAMISQITERLGVAAENTRLFFEARRVADREAQVNEISARLQSAMDVDSMVATAAEGLSTALGAPRVSVRIGVPARDDAREGGGA